MTRPLRVLITRPAQQAQSLVAGVRELGHTALRCPTLVIETPVTSPQDTAALGTCDIAIFISQNAVTYANQLGSLDQLRQSGAAIVAIGAATASALTRLGHDVEPLGAGQSDSEQLLKHPTLQALTGKQVVLVRGEGGRDLIAQTVRARGAQLCEHIVYRRRSPTASEFEHSRALLQNVDVILCGSDEALDNLVTLAGDAIRSQLLGATLIVNSPRNQRHAELRGFYGTISVAMPAGDIGQLHALAGLPL